jgi:para-aminobenzoate synthetase component 1
MREGGKMIFNKALNTVETMEEIYSKVSNESYISFLDSSSKDTKLNRYSYIAINPFARFISKGKQVTVFESGVSSIIEGNPIKVVQSLMDKYHQKYDVDAVFTGGAIGYFSYDLGRIFEKIESIADDDKEIPDIYLAFYHGVIVHDHLEGGVYYRDYNRDGNAQERYEHIETLLKNQRDMNLEKFQLTALLETNMSIETYKDSVKKIRKYIKQGDIYQANMTRRYQAPYRGDLRELYIRLRQKNPAPFSAFLETGDLTILSSSPERFFEVRGDIIRTRPIKGTAPRGKTYEEDERNKNNLLESEKDKAELLMIVDLERNDLGRIAEIGSVKVSELFALETYETVFHLVATVEAKLNRGNNLETLLRAMFPGGSITGAPKIRAMEIIEELEPTRRNIYTGSIGYLDFNGNIDLNIAIRTLIAKDDFISYQVGGGIVWDSEEELEYQETLHKGKALMEVLMNE